MADFYWQGTSSTDWSNKDSWVTTDGGSTHPASAPDSNAVCYFTAASSSANCTVDNSSCVCNQILVYDWAQTLTIASGNRLSVGLYAEFSSSMSCSGTGYLKLNTANIFTGGKALTYVLEIGSGLGISIDDDCTVGGLYVTATNELSGSDLYIKGDLIVDAALSGTTDIILNGTGTWSAGSSSGTLANNLTFNTAGTITISGTVYKWGGTITYTAGTVTTTDSTLITSDSFAVTFDTDGMDWNNITFGTNDTVAGPSGGYTISSPLSVDGTFRVRSYTSWNGSDITISGSLSITFNDSTRIPMSGTAKLILDGTGTWSSSANMGIRNDLEINTAGTITLSGTIYYQYGTLTYTAGTMTVTSSTLNLKGACTLDINGAVMNNITFSTAGTYAITTGLNLTGALTVSDDCTFDNLVLDGPPSSVIIGSGKLATTDYFSIDTDATHRTSITSSSTAMGAINLTSGVAVVEYCDIAKILWVQASTSPTSPGTGSDDSGTGTLTWSNPGNIISHDTDYASVVMSSSTTHYLKASNFGFSIPATAQITGIKVEIEKKCSDANLCKDNRVSIVKSDGSVGSTDKKLTPSWTTSDTYYTYGSLADLWGETWTPSDINNSNFGVVLSATRVAPVTSTAYVNHMRITIGYSDDTVKGNASSRTNTLTYGDATGWMVPNNILPMVVTNI